MKLTIKIFFMFIGSVLTSVIAGFILTMIFFGVPQRGFRIDSFGAVIINLLCNIGGFVMFGCLVYYLIIKRIKNIGIVTRDVAKGNYDMQLSTQGFDEISDLAQDFNSMTKELKANEYLNREYVKNISHEIKTPLSSIQGYATMILENNYDVHKIKQYIKIIADEAEKMRLLSTQMLYLSMLESSNIIKMDDVFKADEQIREVIILMQHEWQKKNIIFNIEMDNAEICGNRELTRQIWQNLISNAIKYSHEGGIITIRLKNTDKLYFEITDAGIGISEENKKYIFRQFYTAENSDGKNNGIGLSLAKKIVEKMGGNIRFESLLDQGTTFYVTLNTKYKS